MAILTSAFAYLGSYYSEANPSLQGTCPFCVSLRCFPLMTFVYARPETLHEWRPILTRQHGQADLQDHWESHITSCVRTARSLYTANIVRPSRAEVATGWPIVSAKAVSLSYLRQGSRIPDSASLAVPPCPQLFDVVGQVLVPDGSSWPRELQTVSRARKGSRRAVSPARRPRTQRELHHGTSDRQLIGRPIFCYRVSSFCDSLGGEADMKIIALNRAGCASL